MLKVIHIPAAGGRPPSPLDRSQLFALAELFRRVGSHKEPRVLTTGPQATLLAALAVVAAAEAQQTLHPQIAIRVAQAGPSERVWTIRQLAVLDREVLDRHFYQTNEGFWCLAPQLAALLTVHSGVGALTQPTMVTPLTAVLAHGAFDEEAAPLGRLEGLNAARSLVLGGLLMCRPTESPGNVPVELSKIAPGIFEIEPEFAVPPFPLRGSGNYATPSMRLRTSWQYG